MVKEDPKLPTSKPTFSEQDSEKLVELLNFIATNAKFNNLDVKSCIKFTKLLNWCQVELLPKIDAYKFEVVSVKPAKAEKK
jgi:hypothetical protein